MSSSAYGFTLAWNWTQTSSSYTFSNDIWKFDFYGNINFNIYFQNIGSVFGSPRHYQIQYNTKDGTWLTIELNTNEDKDSQDLK